MFVVIDRPPGPYSKFLSNISDFSNQISSDKIIIVSDLSIHVDVENNNLNTVFNLLLDSTDFYQTVNEIYAHFKAFQSVAKKLGFHKFRRSLALKQSFSLYEKSISKARTSYDLSLTGTVYRHIALLYNHT